MLVLKLTGTDLTLTGHVVKKAEDLPRLMRSEPEQFDEDALYYAARFSKGYQKKDVTTTTVIKGEELSYDGTE